MLCPVLCSGRGTYVSGQCRCPPGYKGRECELRQDQCEVTHCNRRGRCEDGACRCDRGYTGEFCELGGYRQRSCVSIKQNLSIFVIFVLIFTKKKHRVKKPPTTPPQRTARTQRARTTAGASAGRACTGAAGRARRAASWTRTPCSACPTAAITAPSTSRRTPACANRPGSAPSATAVS